MSPERSGRFEIGATLRDARRRYGMEVREVEERTKIRARYIRALENDDWEALPAPAYVRGFLRTYGRLLGLDGEMLADEYRRRFGEVSAPGAPGPPEPVLSESRRPGERSPSRAPLILGVVVAIIGVLLVLSLFGGDGEDGGDGRQQGRERAQQGNDDRGNRRNRGNGGNQGRNQGQSNALEQEDARLVARSNVQVCLVAGGGEALIDNQVLSSGAREEYGGAKRYRLTIGPGEVRLKVGDSSRDLAVGEPASFEADSTGIREIDYRGPACP